MSAMEKEVTGRDVDRPVTVAGFGGAVDGRELTCGYREKQRPAQRSWPPFGVNDEETTDIEIIVGGRWPEGQCRMGGGDLNDCRWPTVCRQIINLNEAWIGEVGIVADLLYRAGPSKGLPPSGPVTMLRATAYVRANLDKQRLSIDVQAELFTRFLRAIGKRPRPRQFGSVLVPTLELSQWLTTIELRVDDGQIEQCF